MGPCVLSESVAQMTWWSRTTAWDLVPPLYWSASLNPWLAFCGSNSATIDVLTQVVLQSPPCRSWTSVCVLHFTVVLISISLRNCSTYLYCTFYIICTQHIFMSVFEFLLVHLQWLCNLTLGFVLGYQRQVFTVILPLLWLK